MDGGAFQLRLELEGLFKAVALACGSNQDLVLLTFLGFSIFWPAFLNCFLN